MVNFFMHVIYLFKKNPKTNLWSTSLKLESLSLHPAISKAAQVPHMDWFHTVSNVPKGWNSGTLNQKLPNNYKCWPFTSVPGLNGAKFQIYGTQSLSNPYYIIENRWYLNGLVSLQFKSLVVLTHGLGQRFQVPKKRDVIDFVHRNLQ